MTSSRFDRSVQTDARAEPARPEGGIASDAEGGVEMTSVGFDRSVQTDARAEPARPEGGIASDAFG